MWKLRVSYIGSLSPKPAGWPDRKVNIDFTSFMVTCYLCVDFTKKNSIYL